MSDKYRNDEKRIKLSKTYSKKEQIKLPCDEKDFVYPLGPINLQYSQPVGGNFRSFGQFAPTIMNNPHNPMHKTF